MLMLGNLTLPQIVGIGVFDANIRYRGVRETPKRGVSIFEIDLAAEDGGAAYINDTVIPIKEGLLICAKPGNIRHTALPYRCYYIHLMATDGVIKDILSRCPDTFMPKDPESFRKIFLKLVEAYNFPNETSSLVVAENLLLLCRMISAEVGDILIGEHLKKRGADPEIIERAIAYIKNNYTEKMTLENISSHVNMSPTYFHKLFLKAVGRTPNEYLLDIRIRAAKSLLLTTDKPLVYVASECGFASQSYFNYTFKRAEKMTPREYRSLKNNEYLGL